MAPWLSFQSGPHGASYPFALGDAQATSRHPDASVELFWHENLESMTHMLMLT